MIYESNIFLLISIEDRKYDLKVYKFCISIKEKRFFPLWVIVTSWVLKSNFLNLDIIEM